MFRVWTFFFMLVFTLMVSVTAAQTFEENLQTNANDARTEVSQSSGDLNTLVQYLGNLGLNLGYNLTSTVNSSTVIDTLLTYLDSSNGTLGQEIFEQTAFWSLLGSIPVDAYSQTLEDFVPSNNTYASLVNGQANFTFPSYTTPSQTIPSVISGVDQLTYQNDPVSQAVLNILSTPDYSFCTNSSSSSTSSSTSSSSSSSTSSACLSQVQIMQNVLQDISSSGTWPGATQFYNYSNFSPYVSQLNANVLIGPLLYSTTNASSSSTSSGSTSSTAGIPSATQAQQAANFIRYATGGLSPPSLINNTTFSTLWSEAYDGLDSSGNPLPNSSGTPLLGQDPTALQAQATLTSYLTGIRVYAAQSSVAIGNLYEILARRLPQTDPNNSTTTSRALSEFQLASWRLYNPQNSNQWITEINTASAATVQKETAILLSEINYQLYLNRQLEERILLTNSLQLLQNLVMNRPSASVPPSSTGTSQPTS